MTKMWLYRENSVVESPVRRPNAGELAFVVLEGASEAEIRHVVGDIFQSHDVVIDRCLSPIERPKLSLYADHVFFPFYFLRDDWELIKVSVMMGEQFVIALFDEPMPFLDELLDEYQEEPEKMRHPGRMLYEFLDFCVHRYLDFVDQIEDTVDRMESEIYESPQNNVAPDIFSLKRSIHKIRRTFGDERTVVERIMHANFPYSRQEETVYFVDLFDHINRIVDEIDGFRDALTGLLDLQMSLKSDRMNQIMKTLTIVSTFFMPLSFIVGLYGVNLKVPEYQWAYGYLWIWGWIVASVVGLWIFFRKRGWF